LGAITVRLAFFRTDRAEDVGRGGARVARAEGRVPRFAQPRVILSFWPTRALTRALSRDVDEPDFYRAGIDALFPRNFLQAGREVFFKSPIAFAASA
jgi:hypothetical protein